MLEVGSLVDGKYRITKKIGQGGMSVVFMAINEKANKTWAIKEIRRDAKTDLEMVKKGLIAESEILKNLNHPNLPSIADIIENDDNYIIVMDYIEGDSLDKVIEEHGAQSEVDVLEWAKQICGVLGYLHSRKPPIIYRDMKPANVMLKPDGNVMLIDFGTAKNLEINIGETTGIGTLGYAAPEQWAGNATRTDARTDIYSLGMTMYQLLTNINPSKTFIEDKSIRSINPDFSYGLDAIIQKCTQYKPIDRYQSCEELMYDLNNCVLLEPDYKRKQRMKVLSFFATVAFSVLMLFCGFVCNNSSSQVINDSLKTLALCVYIIGIFLMVVSIVMFFCFKIPKLVDELTGKMAKREIETIRQYNESGNKKIYKSDSFNIERGKLTSKINTSGNLNSNSTSLAVNLGTEKIVTSKLTTYLNETTVLENTDVLIVGDNSASSTFTIEIELFFTGSSEIIE